MNIQNIFLTGFSMVALCATGCGSSANNSAPASNATQSQINSLNALSNSAQRGMTIHFDSISLAEDVTSGPTGIACPASGCPAAPHLVHISGVGGISANGILIVQVNNLDLTVTFDPTINNGQSCLTAAQSAFTNFDQLDIQGQATILPVDSASGVTAGSGSSGTITVGPNDATDLQKMVATAASIDSQALPAPTFNSNSVGVVISQIDSCTVGAASPGTPPTPAPTTTPGSAPAAAP